jgi:hypothetical protein
LSFGLCATTCAFWNARAPFFRKYQELFLSACLFVSVLDRMRRYYLYEDSEKEVTRGDGAMRRSAAIDVKKCRGQLIELLLAMSKVGLSVHDFGAVIGHIMTLPDKAQKQDLLKLLQEIPSETEVCKVEWFTRIHRLLKNYEEEIVIPPICSIVGGHSVSKTSELTLSDHFQNILKRYLRDRITSNLYEVCCTMVVDNGGLFP